MFRERALPVLIWAAYRLLRATWRVSVLEPAELARARANGERIVFAHWHGDELALLSIIGRYKCAVMTSTSKDGELMTRVLTLMGVPCSRGSSTRGGASALKGLLRLARDGYRPTVAVDGPKGPYRKVKPGVFEVSRIVDGAIFATGCAASHAHVFEKAWNKTYLPLPFARIQVVFSQPLPAIRREDDPRATGLAELLEKALANAGQQARNLIATPWA